MATWIFHRINMNKWNQLKKTQYKSECLEPPHPAHLHPEEIGKSSVDHKIHTPRFTAPSTRQALLDFWRSLGDFRYRSLVMKLHEMWLLSLKQQLLDIPDSSVKVKQPLNEILGNKNNMGMTQNGGRTPNSYVHLWYLCSDLWNKRNHKTRGCQQCALSMAPHWSCVGVEETPFAQREHQGLRVRPNWHRQGSIEMWSTWSPSGKRMEIHEDFWKKTHTHTPNSSIQNERCLPFDVWLKGRQSGPR